MAYAMKLSFYVLCALALPTVAAAMECDGRLVEVGQSEEEVLDLCGPPARREVRNRGNSQVVGVEWQSPETEEWTYDPAPGAFVQHLLFEDGRLTQIRSGGYADLDSQGD